MNSPIIMPPVQIAKGESNITLESAIVGPCLVIGGNGWMGSFLAFQLSQYFQNIQDNTSRVGIPVLADKFMVHVMDISQPRSNIRHLHRYPNIRWHQCDISDNSSVLRVINVINPRFIWHTCSIIDLRICPSVNLESVNIQGTKNILTAIAALSNETTRFLIYTSTIDVACYGTRGVKDAKEDDGYAVKSPSKYELTKIKAEQMIIAANSKSLRTCALRPGLCR